jgi:hypothetical protein
VLTHDPDPRPVQVGEHRRQAAGVGHVDIGVHRQHVVSSSSSPENIPAAAAAQVCPLLEQPQLRAVDGKSPQIVGGAVGRAVVEDEPLGHLWRLGQPGHRRQEAPDLLAIVPGQLNDRDHSSPCSWR